MRKNNLSKWSITPDIDGMLYFAQRINEMLFDYSLDTYKGRLFNSFMLCAEALDCIDKIKSNLISSQNLPHIIEELNWSLENDKVIDALLEEEKSLFYPLNAHDSFENITPILELLSIRILPIKYEAKCRELLINHIKANKKKAIDSLLESWLCLIKVWGYSDEWIYHYSNNYFFNSTNNIDNIAYLDGFFNSFQFKSKEYDAYLIVDKILKTVITNSVTIIGSSAFYNCENLRSIIIPQKITHIGKFAFGECYKLKNIYCRALTPPSLEPYAFLHLSHSAQIYVPKTSVELYKKTKGWEKYAKQIVGYDF